jgi:hypothetical protein
MASYASFLADPTRAVVFARATQAPARTLYSTLQSSVVAIGVAIPSRIEGAAPMYKINAAAKVPFKAVDSSGNGLTGLTITAKTGKDGANPTTCSNAVQESGQGWYYITLTATEMNGEIIVLDATAAGATIAPIAIHTEADYTTTRAGYLDAAVSSRSTYAGGAVASVTAGVTVSTNNDKAGYALSSAGVQAIWDALTSALTTVGSIGKRIADYLTGDAFARLGAPAGASVSADIASISLATNAGDMTTKQADSATLVTGSNTSGSYSNTGTDDDVFWITAPVSPAVGGFGLRQRLVFDLPLGRTPVNVQIRGYFQGSGATVEVYALNSRTGAYDQLTNSRTDLATRTSETTYSIPLPRDYADDSGGASNIVTLEFRSTSTTTSHRLRLDQVLVTHVAEDAAITFTAPSAEQIWSYVTRELTTPGAEPVTVPTAVEIRTEIDANSTQLAKLGAPAGASMSADIAAVKSDTAAVKAKTDNLPATPASSSDVSALDTALAALDTKLGTPAGASVSADVATVKSDTAAVKTKTDQLVFTVANKVDANIRAVNDVTVTGSGAPSDPWGP